MPGLRFGKLFEHSVNVYNKMLEQSIREGDNILFTGKTTEILTALGLGNSYYTPIFRFLKSSGSIDLVRRGGGGSSSVYRMVRRPAEEEFFKYNREPIAKTNKENSTEIIGTVLTKVEKLFEGYYALTGILNKLQTRVSDLQMQVTALEVRLDHDGDV